MAGELSKMNFRVAERAAGLNGSALLRILDSFVEDPGAVGEIAEAMIQAADAGQLAPQIAEAVFPAVQQIMAANAQAQQNKQQGA